MAHAPFHFGSSDRSREPIFPRLNDFFSRLFNRGGPSSPQGGEGRTAASGPGRIARGVGHPGPQLATSGLPRTSGSVSQPPTPAPRPQGQSSKPPPRRPGGTGSPSSQLPPVITFGFAPLRGVGKVGVTGTIQLTTDTSFGQAVGGVIQEFQGDPGFANDVFRLLGVDPRNGPQVLAAFQQEFNRTVAIFGGDEDLARESFLDMLRNRIQNQGVFAGGGGDDFITDSDRAFLESLVPDFGEGEVPAVEEGEQSFGPIIDPRLDPNQDEFRFF